MPYAKPGLPLTREIMQAAQAETRIFVLENHGLIVCGADVAATEAMMEEVEERLVMPPLRTKSILPDGPPTDGCDWAAESWIACNPFTANLARAGSYYPDHVVFLGPALPAADHEGAPPAILIDGKGIALRWNATASQRAMLRCLSDLLVRLPANWTPQAIGPEAEAELLNWDAEKYRQALAARG